MAQAAPASGLAPIRRVVLKVGTAVVTQRDGHAALGRVGGVVEAVCDLRLQGVEVILVTSGAVGIGAQVLKRQAVMSASLSQVMDGVSAGSSQADAVDRWPPRACAAAGQSGLQSLYETLFAQYDTACSQVLVTDADLEDGARRAKLQTTLRELLGLGIVPILNENDVVTTRETPLTDGDAGIWWDNDSLAALVAARMGADLLLLLTDTDGLYTPQGEHVRELAPGTEVGAVAGSRVGARGMRVMADALRGALADGVRSAAVLSGFEPNAVQRMVAGDSSVRATVVSRRSRL